MPYIGSKSKLVIDHQLDVLLELVPKLSEGELNYVITKIVDHHLARGDRINYRRVNAVIGVLECAKLELYRRIAGPYEDIKKDEHGDVYETAEQIDGRELTERNNGSNDRPIERE